MQLQSLFCSAPRLVRGLVVLTLSRGLCTSVMRDAVIFTALIFPPCIVIAIAKIAREQEFVRNVVATCC